MGCIILAGTVGGRLASLDAMSLFWQASWIVQLVIGVLVLLSVALVDHHHVQVARAAARGAG